MTFAYSISMIAPADYADAINAMGGALGHGTPSLSVPLSADGTEPATHYGGHAWAQQSFVDLLTAGAQRQIPPALADAGYTAADVAALLSHLSTAVHPNEPGQAKARFDALADSMGLQGVVIEP